MGLYFYGFLQECKKKKIVLTISIFIQMKVYFLFLFFLESTHFALRWHSFVDSQIYLTVEEAE